MSYRLIIIIKFLIVSHTKIMSLDRLRKVWNDISKSSQETSPVRANIVGGSRVVPSNRDLPVSVAGGGETSPSPVRPNRLFGDTSQVRLHVLMAAAVERAPLTIERVALEENKKSFGVRGGADRRSSEY